MIRRSLVLSVAAVAIAVVAARPARAGEYETLGTLERQSVDDALQARGLTLDPGPAGKVIGAIHVVNQEVFSGRDWLFQFFNIFHRTTREDAIRRELLMRPGQPYRQSLVDESVRNLQSPPGLSLPGGRSFYAPELSSVVVILPVRSAQPGHVDLLVVTRDVWSLRLNTNFEYQQGSLVYLSTSLSENNLLGWRKFLSMAVEMDQGAVGIGPAYFDPNIGGTRLQLLTQASLWYGRESQAYEGNFETFSLRYPLYSLASHWSAGIDGTHQDTVVRLFQGNELYQRPLRSLPGSVTVPYVYRQQRSALDADVTASWGTPLIQRFSIGYVLDQRRYQFTDEFPQDAVLRAAFVEEALPPEELRSAPYLGYEAFTPDYRVYRNLDTFDLRENRRLGTYASARVTLGSPALGSDFRYTGISAYASYSASVLGGFQTANASLSGRWRDGQYIDQHYSLEAYAASPVLLRTFRVVTSAELAWVRADTQKSLYQVGGRNGLRGYMIGEFTGTAQMIAHVELRSMAYHLWSQRLGWLLFWDAGHAAASVSELTPYNDVGVGLRWLIPQLNSSVLRIDWAFALQDAPQPNPDVPATRAGWPGRYSAGFQQVF